MMSWSQLSFRSAPHSSLVEAQLISLRQSWDVNSWGSLSRPYWSPRAHQDQSCSGISVFNSWDSRSRTWGPGKTAPEWWVKSHTGCHWNHLEAVEQWTPCQAKWSSATRIYGEHIMICIYIYESMGVIHQFNNGGTSFYHDALKITVIIPSMLNKHKSGRLTTCCTVAVL